MQIEITDGFQRNQYPKDQDDSVHQFQLFKIVNKSGTGPKKDDAEQQWTIADQIIWGRGYPINIFLGKIGEIKHDQTQDTGD